MADLLSGGLVLKVMHNGQEYTCPLTLVYEGSDLRAAEFKVGNTVVYEAMQVSESIQSGVFTIRPTQGAGADYSVTGVSIKRVNDNLKKRTLTGTGTFIVDGNGKAVTNGEPNAALEFRSTETGEVSYRGAKAAPINAWGQSPLTIPSSGTFTIGSYSIAMNADQGTITPHDLEEFTE